MMISSSSSSVLSCISWNGYAAGSQARISSFQFISSSSTGRVSDPGSSYYPKSPPLINTRGVRTMSVCVSVSAESVGRIPSPWLMLPPAAFNKADKNMTYKFYSLAEKEVVSFDGEVNWDLNYNIHMALRRGKFNITDYEADLVGSSHGWLALLKRTEESMFLTNPVSRRSVELPSFETLAGITEYYYDYGGCGVKNVVLSCSPDKEECRAMMIFAYHNRLAFCCPRRGLEWTPIGNVYDQITRNPRSYESVVYSSRQNLFFSVTKLLEFEAWDLSDPRSPRRISMDDVKVDKGKSLLACEAFRNEYKDKADILDRQFLVIAEHSDELFLVRQFVMNRMGADGLSAERICHGRKNNKAPYKTIGFDVHRYDPVARAFNYIDTGTGVHEYDPEIKALKYNGGGGGSSLEGLALFVGLNDGFALRADEYPELRHNSIYFTDTEYVAAHFDPDDETYDDDYDKHERRRYGGHDLGIFNYEDGTFSPCYYPCDYGSIQKIRPPPTWFTPSPPL